MINEKDTACYCRHCIDYLKTQGYRLYVGNVAVEYDESEQYNIVCDWCQEIDELLEVRF